MRLLRDRGSAYHRWLGATALTARGREGVERLEAELREAPYWRDRYESARVLAQLAPLAGVNWIGAGLRDPSFAVRLEAVRAAGLTRLASMLPRLALLLEDPAWQVRRAVARAIHRIGDPEGLPALVALSADSDLLVRREAMRVLLHRRDGSSMEALARTYESADDALRRWILDRIGPFAPASFHPLLARDVTDRGRADEVRVAAAVLLVRSEPTDPALRVLAQAVMHADATLRHLATVSLQEAGRRAVTFLREGLREHEDRADAHERYLGALAAILGHEAAEELKERVRGHGPFREIALRMLWRVGDAADVAGFIEEQYPREKDDRMRQALIERACRVPGPRLVELLRGALREEERFSVRSHAFSRLLQEQDPALIPDLVEAMRREPEKKYQALLMRSLAMTKPPGAFEVLVDLAGHDDFEVRRAAAESLGSFGDTPHREEAALRLEERFEAEGRRILDTEDRLEREYAGAVRRKILESLARLRGVALVPDLNALLEKAIRTGDEDDLCRTVIACLGRSSSEEAVDRLLAALRDPAFSRLRLDITHALARQESPRAQEALVSELRRADEATAHSILRALPGRPQGAVLDYVVEKLARFEAIRIPELLTELIRLAGQAQDDAVIEPLTRLCSGIDQYEPSRAALEALASLGQPEAEGALLALLDRLEDALRREAARHEVRPATEGLYTATLEALAACGSPRIPARLAKALFLQRSLDAFGEFLRLREERGPAAALTFRYETGVVDALDHLPAATMNMVVDSALAAIEEKGTWPRIGEDVFVHLAQALWMKRGVGVTPAVRALCEKVLAVAGRGLQDFEAHVLLGEVLAEHGDLEGAASHWGAALAMLQEGDLSREQAEHVVGRSAVATPVEVELEVSTQGARAIVLGRRGHLDEARAIIGRIASQAARDGELLIEVSMMLTRAGLLPDEVRGLIDRARGSFVEERRVLHAIGTMALRWGDPCEAGTVLEQALEASRNQSLEDLGGLWVDVARARVAMGDRAGARQALESASHYGLRYVERARARPELAGLTAAPPFPSLLHED